MIRHLSINNLMLIKKIDMDIGIGLCVLTGETGAGKSMILESLDLLSGRRIKPNLRPENGNKTIISALIDISNFAEIRNLLTTLEIDFEDEIVVKRTIETDGKSKALVNDNLVSLSTLKEIASTAIEVHSQFSEQGLLDNSKHIRTLDEFGNYKEKLLELSESWKEFKKIEKEFSNELERLNEIKNKMEDYVYDLKELKALDPKKGEFEKLEQDKKMLQNSRKIHENLNEVIDNFVRDNPPGIENLLSSSITNLNQIRDLLDNQTTNEIERLNSISIEMSESIKYFQNLMNDEGGNKSLEEIEDRVDLYRKLSKKHLVEPDQLKEKIEEFKKNIEFSEESQSEINKISEKLKFNEEKFLKQSTIISDKRKENAKILDKKINLEFPDLKLENAEFKTFFHETIQTSSGKDKVIFNIKTNPTSKMDEIKNISSGGELCRIALAIKVTAEKTSSSTIVFDEVDSGIGGAVSTAVGERLKKLGEKRQVLVVTHSPQVASLGTNHFLVKKITDNDSTSIHVIKIDGQDKVNEIARMLSGKHITEEAIQAAKKLIENY